MTARLRALYAWWRALSPGTRGYLLLVAFVSFAAFNTVNNLLYLVAGLMLSLLAVGAFLARVSMRKLRMTRHLPPHVHAGENVDVRLTLGNDKRRLATFAVTVRDTVDETPTHEAFLLALPPRESRTTTYRHTFTKRGRHMFGALRAESAFPFGFIPRKVTLAGSQPVVVYPQIDAVDETLLGAIADPQSFMHLTRGAGANICGIREYRSDDDARHITWKLSAKAGRLLMREFETERANEVALIFDNGVPAESQETVERFEAAVRLTASLAAALVDQHFTVRLITRSGRSPADRGQQHLYSLLYTLALIEPVWPDADGQLPGLPLHDVNPALSAVVLADADAGWVSGSRFPVVLTPRWQEGRVVAALAVASGGGVN